VKSLTVRLPETLVAELDAESRARQLTRSDVVRERLESAREISPNRPATLDAIADVIGSIDRLPADVSSRAKAHLRRGYGRKRPR
jgi:Arc/MetJ-type ribon-helix-helix transcriptional regulator